MTNPNPPNRISVEGRQRIAAFMHATLGWDGQDAMKRLVASGRVSKATIDRVKRGENVSDTMLRAMGDALGLPRDFLLDIGLGNVDRIERLYDDPDRTSPDWRDLIRWTLDLFPAAPGEPPRIRSA